MKKIMLLLLTLVSSPLFAGVCNGQNSLAFTIPTLVIQRDTPVGAELFRMRSPDAVRFICSGDPEPRHQVGILVTGSSVGNSIYGKIYPTGFPGVGYSIGVGGYAADTYVNDVNAFPGLPDSVVHYEEKGRFVGGGNVTLHSTIIFYKTGPTDSGRVARVDVGSFMSLLTDVNNSGKINHSLITLNSFNVRTVACSITTPALIFPLGNVPVTSFGSTIGFSPPASNTQDLGLNCDADANVYVQIMGRQHPDLPDAPTVMALDNQGEEGTASGVGIRLYYNGQPYPVNKKVYLKKMAGGQESLPLTARYIQTKPVVQAGVANASATLVLTYQ